MNAPRSGPRLPRSGRLAGGPTSRHRQRGVALLVAILLVALGTIIAAAMAYNNAMTARRAAATFSFDQALLVAEGAEALAAYGLQQTAKQNPSDTDPSQPWNQPLGPVEALPGVMLQAHLEDLQGRFNINELVQADGVTRNTPAIQAFQRLLTMLNLPPELADHVVDWIDKNPTTVSSDGAGDSVYMEMDPPYREPKLPITSTSELLAVQGFTRAAFDRLAPYIVALPLGVQINTCTASGVLLDALMNQTQFSNDPEQFQKDRQAQGGCFPDPTLVTSEAKNVPGGGFGAGGGTSATGGVGGGGGGTPQTLASLLTKTSQWFRLTTFISIGSTEFAVYTELYAGQTGTARPIMRSFTPD